MTLTPDDIQQRIADSDSLIAERPASIVIRRGETSLPAQSFLLSREAVGGGRKEGQGVAEVQATYLAIGERDLDIAIGDRFNAGGVLYVVRHVRESRLVQTVAECVVKI
jgi:hypothetical protein